MIAWRTGPSYASRKILTWDGSPEPSHVINFNAVAIHKGFLGFHAETG